MCREAYVGKSVLVAGGAGFIGSHLVDKLLTDGGRQVIAIHNLLLGTRDIIKVT